MKNQFRYTILYVQDVPRTLRFFEEAFALEPGMLHESHDYGELSTGETKLAFASRGLLQELGKTPGSPRPDAPVFEVGIETADVEQAFVRAVQAGATPVQRPRVEPWGQTTSYVSDENGFLIELCSKVPAPADEPSDV